MLKSWWTAAGAAAVLAGVLVTVSPDAPDTAAEDEAMVLVGGHGGDHRGPMHFQLEGKPVRGLYPGAVRQMRITVFNPFGARLRVQQVSGKVTSSSRKGCAASSANLQVRAFTGKLPALLPAHGRTTLAGTLPIAMPTGASEKCAGARFTISISATGFRVDR